MAKKLQQHQPPMMEAARYLVLLTNVGLVMLSSIMVCFGLGVWLEKHFPSKGVFLAVATFLGVAAGMYYLYKILTRFLDEESKREQTDS